MSLALNEYILDDIINITSNKVDTKNLVLQQYISTENMLPDRKGICLAASMPSGKVNQFLKNDTLFSNIRTYFRKVWFASFDGGSSPDVLIFRTKDVEVLDPRFLYYLISDQKFIDYSDKTSKGAKMPRGDKSAILNYKTYLPTLSVQKRISKILSDLDDKIHLNNQINQTLESIAQAIFKSWFIDFEPVRAKIAAKQEGKDPEFAAMCAISGKSEAELEQMAKEDFAELQATAALFPDELVDSELGEVPKGWEIGCVGDIATVRGGYAFKSLQFVDKGYPVIKIKNITGDGKVDIQDTQCIEEKTAQIASKFILNDSDLVMAMTGATVGKIGLVNTYSKLVYLNQRVAKFESDTFGNKVGYYLFCLFNRSEYFEQIVGTAQGSAQPNISSSGIESTRIIVPNFEVINLFIRKVDSIFQYWLENGSVNNTLREVRDTLLPKLLSGEIDISELQGAIDD